MMPAEGMSRSSREAVIAASFRRQKFLAPRTAASITNPESYGEKCENWHPRLSSNLPRHCYPLSGNNGTNSEKLTLGYVRLTKEESLRGQSPAAQKSEIETYAERNSLPNLEILEETTAVGGDVPFAKRPAGRRLLEAIKEGRVAHIITRDLDRLTRDIVLGAEFLSLLQAQEVELHTFAGPVRLTSASDRFAVNVRVAAAQFEREQTGDRIRGVKRQLAKQGRPIGGPPVFGYTSQARRRRDLINAGVPEDQATAEAEAEFTRAKCLYIDDKEARIVRLIFDLYVTKRLGSRQIANELNRRGHRRRSGRPWVATQVGKRINDPVVAGLIPFDEESFKRGRAPTTPKWKQAFFPGQHEPIVDEKTWNRAQEIKRANTSSTLRNGNAGVANRRYPLGGVLECACGSRMRAGSTQRKRNRGAYVCKKRYYYGPNGIGGCNRPRITMAKAHAAFWPKLGEIIRGPELAEQVYHAAQHILAAQEQDQCDEDDLNGQLDRLLKDIDTWYERHDSARSDLEKEAAWRRIVQLLERRKQLEKQSTAAPAQRPSTCIARTTREQIAAHLDDLANAIPKSKDGGVALVQSLVENHGLQVQLVDAGRMVIRLAFRPPGVSADKTVEHAVLVETEARFPQGKIDAWLERQNGKRKCKLCGKPIEVKRHHFWQGLPKTHRKCSLAENSRRRANPAGGTLNGRQVAEILGIGRTTVGRWLKRGKLKPLRKQQGVWLFDESEIRQIAAELAQDQIDPGDGLLNGEEVARLCGVSRTTVSRWMKRGKLVPVQTGKSLCLFDRSEVEHFANGSCIERST